MKASNNTDVLCKEIKTRNMTKKAEMPYMSVRNCFAGDKSVFMSLTLASYTILSRKDLLSLNVRFGK